MAGCCEPPLLSRPAVSEPRANGAGLPKHALMNPYQTQPARPSNQRPWVLAAKLKGVPRTLTSRSLAEMLTSRRFMGVRKARYLQNRARTRKLQRKPRVPMKPRQTATTRCPLGLRV